MLSTGYVEAGPASGHPVILMHGFPYDIHSYVQVAPLLAAEGYRVIVPYFRGYGTTTFLSAATPRNVDQAAFALDILALMDALGIREAILAGHDWGSRTGDIIAAARPGARRSAGCPAGAACARRRCGRGSRCRRECWAARYSRRRPGRAFS